MTGNEEKIASTGISTSNWWYQVIVSRDDGYTEDAVEMRLQYQLQ